MTLPENQQFRLTENRNRFYMYLPEKYKKINTSQRECTDRTTQAAHTHIHSINVAEDKIAVRMKSPSVFLQTLQLRLKSCHENKKTRELIASLIKALKTANELL